ncbi:hypothetical protein FOZ62_030443 [Perkinsus olseni]|uniref:Protein kinase domain-containing protein n=1 Tax=Perkinsus olseni TaxID=32597 RepID=A0A7J6RPV3_PEROL|nr:hypothetical protein FOZ62_030443 [Perkinsus olseni]
MLQIPSTLTRIGIIRDVSSALEFMHAQGYVHRDIKPANVAKVGLEIRFYGKFTRVFPFSATKAVKEIIDIERCKHVC